MKLTVVADVWVKPRHIKDLRPLFTELLDHTLKEEGCIEYSLHQDNEDKSHFMFYEIWETKAFWKKHLDQHHVVHFTKQTKEMIRDFKVKQLSEVN
ncbi:MAG: putative quinol monooxygenase [Bacteroidota bacterium]